MMHPLAACQWQGGRDAALKTLQLAAAKVAAYFKDCLALFFVRLSLAMSAEVGF